MSPLLLLACLALPAAAQLDEGALDSPAVQAQAQPGQPAKAVDLGALPDDRVLAKLRYDYGGSKDLTVKDAFVMALVIHAETWGHPDRADAEAMIWSMAQRSYWSPTWNKKRFHQMLYAYSQPINPIWRRDGRKCKDKEVEPGDKGDPCSEHRLKKRDAFAKLKWKDLDPVARAAVVEWLEGKTTNPVVGAVAWLAPNEWGKKDRKPNGKESYDVKVKEVGSNVFYGREQKGQDKRGVKLQSIDYTGSEVKVEPAAP